MEEFIRTLGQKEIQKNASVVANHLPAWLYKLNGDKVLISFAAENQKLALETKWNGDTPLDPEEVET